MSSSTENFIQGEVKERIDRWIAEYPEDQRQSACMPALRIVQECHDGYLTTDLMDQVAEYLGMAPIAVYEVATFYGNYNHQPVGKYQINWCNSISCYLRGGEELREKLEEKLGVKTGEVSADGKFSIKKVECLGACGGAPICKIGKDYHENLTEESLFKLLDELE
ncbi:MULTISPECIES: NADH-quinone oxidoreductase subunit NuoE [Thiomicrorhabdus]|uniref:NADH-quinone oxidoreductase subunit E n=1 Tax=Thiomicrorhabdus heinhorstiae TaxID=2748010 RepID=A0ABS0BYY4_9GAMM|nr:MULTISPECIES: NADH-quinone oxidoreductase subunit NuoE [Thiomicrorhabdus]MBF6057287.1 NADH-quinone oxidoreductase subunit NuoE [Thiomicrorhabdus heinhorstiae]